MDYIITFDDGSQALMHHGVKGMHWGQWNAETAAKYGKPGSNGPMGGGGGGDDEDEEEKRKREEGEKGDSPASLVDQVIARSHDTAGKNMLAGIVKKAQDKARDEYGLTKTVENNQGRTKTTISARNPTYNLHRTDIYNNGKRMSIGNSDDNTYVKDKDGVYTHIKDLNKVKKRQMR